MTADTTAEDLRERVAEALLDSLKCCIVTPFPLTPVHGTCKDCWTKALAAADHVLAALAGDPGDLPARIAEAIADIPTGIDGLECRIPDRRHREMIAAVAVSVCWEDNAVTVAELAEIKRVTDPPNDGSADMPTDPAEARELWEFTNRQARWQWHMAHKFGDQVEGLRAELAEAQRQAQGYRGMKDVYLRERTAAHTDLIEAEKIIERLSDDREAGQRDVREHLAKIAHLAEFSPEAKVSELLPLVKRLIAILDAPETPGAKREGCDDPDCSRTECLHLGTCWEDAMDPPETPGDAETEGLVMSATHPPLVPVFGEMEPDPGCSDCGTCTLHDGCADAEHPIQDGDCETCGACRACIELCARMRETDPARAPRDAEESWLDRIADAGDAEAMDLREAHSPQVGRCRCGKPLPCTERAAWESALAVEENPETTPDAPTRSPAQVNPQVNAPRTANPAQAPDAPHGESERRRECRDAHE